MSAIKLADVVDALDDIKGIIDDAPKSRRLSVAVDLNRPSCVLEALRRELEAAQ